MRTFKILSLFSALLASPLASAYDARWPDYGVLASEVRGSGPGEYFQGFESPCFAPPLQPASAENDWIRFYSELVRVDTGFAGIFSPAGFNHAEVRPPLPMPPGPQTGAFTRLGGYRTSFGDGFVVEMDVYFDLADPLVTSGSNAAYGWDATVGINNQAGDHRRDFVFHTASNTLGQILVGSSNATNFVPIGSLGTGPHFVVSSTGWYTLQWVFRENLAGSLAVDTVLRNDQQQMLWTGTLNNASDVIATEIGGNRYLWFPYMQSGRLAIDSVRLGSGAVMARAAPRAAPAGEICDAMFANGFEQPGG